MIVDQKSNKPIVGAFIIDGTSDGAKLATNNKPNWIRRQIFHIFLGWKWLSIKEIKETK